MADSRYPGSNDSFFVVEKKKSQVVIKKISNFPSKIKFFKYSKTRKLSGGKDSTPKTTLTTIEIHRSHSTR